MPCTAKHGSMLLCAAGAHTFSLNTGLHHAKVLLSHRRSNLSPVDPTVLVHCRGDSYKIYLMAKARLGAAVVETPAPLSADLRSGHILGQGEYSGPGVVPMAVFTIEIHVNTMWLVKAWLVEEDHHVRQDDLIPYKHKKQLHQASQMRLIRRNTNTRIEDPSTSLETVINVSYDQKKVGLPNKSTQSPGPKRKQRRIVRPNRSKSRTDEHKVVLVPHSTGATHVTGPLRTGHPTPPTHVNR
jgi:hypothetical protein